MSMLFKNCAGSIVFNDEKVFLIKNDKDEWSLPRAEVKGYQLTNEDVIKGINEKTGLNVSFAANEGKTNYEFHNSDHSPVCNRVTWYIMKSTSDKYKLKDSHQITDGGFFTIDEAFNMITHNNDKSIVNLAFNVLKEA